MWLVGQVRDGQADMGIVGGQIGVGQTDMGFIWWTGRRLTGRYGVSWARDKRWTGRYGDSWATGDGNAGVGLVATDRRCIEINGARWVTDL